MISRDGKDIAPFFEPESIAVIGSFRDGMGLGHGTVRNLLNFGFGGRIFPISGTCDEVLGLGTHSVIEEVPGSVDLAVIITPANAVPDVVESCARKGVKAAVVVSEHFAEAGADGAGLQQRVVDAASRGGIRIMGPNTIGSLNTANGLITNPYQLGYDGVCRGSIAYCSQSGIVGAQCHPLGDHAYPISKMCDIANKCDVNEVDILNYLAEDTETAVVAMHMEDVRDGRGFLDAARRLTARKPLVVFKTARSQAGAAASASHTGSLAGNDEVYDTAIRQVGALRVGTWHDYWELPRVFASQRRAAGSRVAIIGSSGGTGVVAADAAVQAGMSVVGYSPDTMRKLSDIDPRAARNPLDLGPILSASSDPGSVQERAVTAVLEDENVDCANIALYVGVLAPVEWVVSLADRLAGEISKPVTIWLYGTNLAMIEETARCVQGRGLPAYTELETSIRALGLLTEYSGFRREARAGTSGARPSR